MKRLLAASLLTLAWRFSAGAELVCHDFTLEQLLPGGQAVVLMVERDDNRVRRLAATVPGQPAIICRVKAHDLQVTGDRLRGSVQLVAGSFAETVQLDVALDGGGRWSLATGLRKVTGDLRVQPATQVSNAHWAVSCESAMGPYNQLRFYLQTNPCAVVELRGYNKSSHELHEVKLALDGTRLAGDIRFTIKNDGWLPPNRQDWPGTVHLEATLDGRLKAGRYAATVGIETQRVGTVAVAAGSLEQLLDLCAAVLPADAPWRVYLMLAGKTGESPAPAADWMRPEYDDSAWPRYQTDLAEYVGQWTAPPNVPAPVRLCLRSSFGVTEPGQVTDLRLKLAGSGDALVAVNGQEIGRVPVPGALDVPARVLVKGRNVLAIQWQGAAADAGGGLPRFQQAILGSVSGRGVVIYDEALTGTRVWSAGSLEQVAATLAPGRVQAANVKHSDRTQPVKGIRQGNPFDPVRPVKMLVPRNGVGSGQVVLSDPAGLRDVTATLGALTGPGGATLPATATQLRYAVQHSLIHYCDALAPTPPTGVTTLPVWLIVQAPKDQAPGWYAGTLALQANGRQFAVPVRVLVSPVVLPNAREFSSRIAIAESPESVALEYAVPCWSDEHLRLLEPSLAMMGQVGNDAVQIPVILGRQASFAVSWLPKNNVSDPGPSRRVPLVRWVKRGDKLEPEFSRLEKFLDLYVKHCGPPQALCLYVWDASSAKEAADVYEGRKVASVTMKPSSPLLVPVWDPATDTTTDTEVPGIGEPGGEAIWRPLFEGVRALVLKRGWPERCIVAGMGGDIRPSQRVGEVLRDWAPYARWYLLSHFSGDPAPKDGRLIATGGLEIGMKEWPAGGCLPVAELERRVLAPGEFLELPTFREHYDNMTPFMFRTVPMKWGAVGRLALDFWPGRGGRSCNSWFSHTERLTVPGEEGALPTVRFQMFREGVQDHEIRAAIIRAYAQLPEDQRPPYRVLLQEFVTRHDWGSRYLSQMELAYDYPAYLARLHATAAELAGTKMDGAWERPPK